MCCDDRVALWIASKLSSATRHAGVQRVPRGEDGLVFADVALLWADVSNTAVAMVDFVHIGQQRRVRARSHRQGAGLSAGQEGRDAGQGAEGNIDLTDRSRVNRARPGLSYSMTFGARVSPAQA